MKNEKINEQKNKQDELAAIGIGAMIVFIALILVAAVASAVIIQTGEKLQQNAQETGQGASESMSTKIMIVSAVRGGANNVVLTLELAPGSESVSDDQVLYTGSCASGTDVGDMNTAGVANMDGGAAGFDPGEMYIVTIALTTCAGADEDTTIFIQAGAGGFTYETLSLAGSAQGDLIV